MSRPPSLASSLTWLRRGGPFVGKLPEVGRTKAQVPRFLLVPLLLPALPRERAELGVCSIESPVKGPHYPLLSKWPRELTEGSERGRDQLSRWSSLVGRDPFCSAVRAGLDFVCRRRNDRGQIQGGILQSPSEPTLPCYGGLEFVVLHLSRAGNNEYPAQSPKRRGHSARVRSPDTRECIGGDNPVNGS